MKRNTQATFMIAALLSCQNTFSSQPNIRNARARLGQIKKQVNSQTNLSAADVKRIRTDLQTIEKESMFQEEAMSLEALLDNKVGAQRQADTHDQKQEAHIKTKLEQAANSSGPQANLIKLRANIRLQSALTDQIDAATKLAAMKRAQADKAVDKKTKASLSNQAQALNRQIKDATQKLTAAQKDENNMRSKLVLPNLDRAKLNNPMTQASLLAEVPVLSNAVNELAAAPASSAKTAPQARDQAHANLEEAAVVAALLPDKESSALQKEIADTKEEIKDPSLSASIIEAEVSPVLADAQAQGNLALKNVVDDAADVPLVATVSAFVPMAPPLTPATAMPVRGMFTIDEGDESLSSSESQAAAAQSTPSPATAQPAALGDALLDEIRAGKTLKKVTHQEKPQATAPVASQDTDKALINKIEEEQHEIVIQEHAIAVEENQTRPQQQDGQDGTD